MSRPKKVKTYSFGYYENFPPPLNLRRGIIFLLTKFLSLMIWLSNKKTFKEISLINNFPYKSQKRHKVIFNELMSSVFSAIGWGLASLFSSTATSVSLATAITSVVSTIGSLIIYSAASIGLSLLSQTLMGRKSPDSGGIAGGGHLVAGHLPNQPLAPAYGQCKIAGTWVYWKTTSTDPIGPATSLNLNDTLHVVVAWGEGECEGIAKDIEQPFFHKSGLNDLSTRGTYSGGSFNRYKIQIDGIGTPNTFKWSDDFGATWTATGVAITGGWQTLNNGIDIKFKSTTGHTNNDWWDFYAGDGIWLGDRLIYYYQDMFGAYHREFAWHTFYTGTSTQAVDASSEVIGTDALNYTCRKDHIANTARKPITGANWNQFWVQQGSSGGVWADGTSYKAGLKFFIPEYDNAHRYTCYSYLRLKYYYGEYNQSGSEDFQVWKSIPEIRITGKWKKVYDTRTSTTVWSRNPALIWRDFLTTARYSIGFDSSLVTTSLIDSAANWCDANSFYFDGKILDKKPFIDHIRDIERNFRAFRVESDGYQKLKIWDDDASVMTFSSFENEVEIDPNSFTLSSPGITEKPKIVKAWFINPGKGDTPDFIKYPDDNTVVWDREFEIEIVGCRSATQAKKIAKFTYLRLNTANRFAVKCHPKCLSLDYGDMITITHPFPNWVSKKLRVDVIGHMQDGLVTMILLDEDAAIYNQTVNVQAEDAYYGGGNGMWDVDPDVTGITFTATAKIGSIFLEWTHPTNDEYWIDEYLIFRNTTDSIPADSAYLVKLPYPTRNYEDRDLVAGTIYYYWIKIKNKNGTISSSSVGSVSKAALSSPVTPDPSQDILALWHFDGPQPYETDFTGDPVDVLGSAPTTLSGGVIYRPGKFGKAVQVAGATTNLCKNPSCETDINGYGSDSVGHTKSQSSDYAYIGAYSLKWTYGSSGSANIYRSGDAPGMVNGQAYTFSCVLRRADGAAITGVLVYIDSTLGTLTPTITSLGNGWYKIVASRTFAAAPGNQVFGVTALPTTVDVYTDAWQLENKAYATPYCDGSLGAGHSWDPGGAGTPHASTSSRTVGNLGYNPNLIDNNVGSILFWFFNEGYGTDGHFLFSAGNTNIEFVITLFGTNTLNAYINDVSGSYAPGSTLYLNWHFVALTWDIPNNQAKLYYDGVLRSTFSPSTTPWTKGSVIYIGRYSTGLPANGYMDDVCILKRVASADEIAAIWESNAPIDVISRDLPDRLPPQPNPPTGLGNDTPTNYNPTATKRQARIYCGAVIDTSGSRVFYLFKWWKQGSSNKVESSGWIGDPEINIGNLDIDIIYEWTVEAKDEAGNKTSATAVQSFDSGHDTVAPAAPATFVVTGGVKVFACQWTKNSADKDMKGGEYRIYVNTSADPNTAVIIARKSHPSSQTTLSLGTISEGGGITLTAGTPYHFYITSTDKDGNESGKIYVGGARTAYQSASDDTTAPTPNPVTGLTSSATVQSLEPIKIQADLGWDVCTDDSGKNVSYRLRWWKSTEPTLIHKHTVFNTNFATLKGLEPNITIYWDLTAYDWQNNTTAPQSPAASFSTADDAVAPAYPTLVTPPNLIGGGIEFEWDASTELDVKTGGGYVLYVNTVNNSGTAVVMKRIAHPGHIAVGGSARTVKTSVKVLQRSEGTSPIILAYATSYWWWLTTRDRAGNESSKVIFGEVKITKIEWMRHFTTPWKTKNSAIIRKAPAAGSTDTYTVPAATVILGSDALNYTCIRDHVAATSNRPITGSEWRRYWIQTGAGGGTWSAGANYKSKRFAMLNGYRIKGNGAANSSMAYNVSTTFDTSLSTDIRRSPAYTNGFYLKTGDQITVTRASGSSEGWFRCLEFAAETDDAEGTNLIVQGIGSPGSYTVPAGKKFVVTYIIDYNGGAGNQLSLDGALAWDTVDGNWGITRWGIEYNALVVPAGTSLQLQYAGFLVGVELDEDASV